MIFWKFFRILKCHSPTIYWIAIRYYNHWISIFGLARLTLICNPSTDSETSLKLKFSQKNKLKQNFFANSEKEVGSFFQDWDHSEHFGAVWMTILNKSKLDPQISCLKQAEYLRIRGLNHQQSCIGTAVKFYIRHSKLVLLGFFNWRRKRKSILSTNQKSPSKFSLQYPSLAGYMKYWPLLWMCRTGYCTAHPFQLLQSLFLKKKVVGVSKNEYQSLFLHFVSKILISVSKDFL